jgi:hypothetical protein
MDIKFLSRKFIMSMLLGIIATFLLITHNIPEEQFGIVIIASVVSYIASRTIDKKYSEGKLTFPAIKDRIESLFSREFIVAIITVIGISWLKFNGLIGSELWFQVIAAIGGVYNIFNAIEKIQK